MGLGGWFGALIFFLVLQLSASALRFYVRLTWVKKLGQDDIAAFVTLIFASAYCCCLIAVFILGQNKPAYDLPTSKLFPATKLVLANVLLYVVGTACLKLSLGLLLLRILVKKWHRIVIFTVMGITAVYGVIFFFFDLFECGAPAQFYLRILEGQCFAASTTEGLAYTHAVLSAAADIIFALLPISYLRTAHLDHRTKISVGLILGLGSAGCICTIIRVPWIHYLTGVTVTFFQTAQGIAVLSAAEMSIGITCLSLTTYKPLFHQYFPLLRKSQNSGDSATPQHKAEIEAASRGRVVARMDDLEMLDSAAYKEEDWSKHRDVEVWSVSRLSSGPASEVRHE